MLAGRPTERSDCLQGTGQDVEKGNIQDGASANDLWFFCLEARPVEDSCVSLDLVSSSCSVAKQVRAPEVMHLCCMNSVRHIHLHNLYHHPSRQSNGRPSGQSASTSAPEAPTTLQCSTHPS